MALVRVMIVEDSPVVRLLLENIVGSDPRLEVAASASSAEEALRLLSRVEPDVISMDIRLPGMDGLEAIKRIMVERPTPTVVVSGAADDDLEIEMEALKAGALSVLEKPRGVGHRHYAAVATSLCDQLVMMSQVSVVRQRRERKKAPDVSSSCPGVVSESRRPEATVVGVVASTGGPPALTTVLGSLPEDFPAPVLLVQHIAEPFFDGFVDWLDSLCPMRTKAACSGETLSDGTIYVAPPGGHLKVVRGRLWSDPGMPVCSQCPSGTVLLESMAEAYGVRAVGVVLTGMGSDGADGLLSLHRAGGLTIAQDESTSVVYGMPKAAADLGAADEVLPIGGIAGRLGTVFGCSVEVTS